MFSKINKEKFEAIVVRPDYDEETIVISCNDTTYYSNDYNLSLSEAKELIEYLQTVVTEISKVAKQEEGK